MRQALGRTVISRTGSGWTIDRGGKVLYGVGEQDLLMEPLTAFFTSRQCPGAAIRTALDWAIERARTRRPVIGGFHSPLEQSVLHLLMQARCPVVAVLARPIDGGKLKPDWNTAIAERRMAVVSASNETKRPTSESVVQRNELVAELAESIVIAHASKGGELARQSGLWSNRGSRVLNLTLNRPAG